MSHMQDSIAQLGRITNIHQGQWIMARDNRRRPFWYHTVTRETTWVDPMRTSDQPTQEHEVGRIVGLHDLDYLQSPNACTLCVRACVCARVRACACLTTSTISRAPMRVCVYACACVQVRV